MDRSRGVPTEHHCEWEGRRDARFDQGQRARCPGCLLASIGGRPLPNFTGVLNPYPMVIFRMGRFPSQSPDDFSALNGKQFFCPAFCPEWVSSSYATLARWRPAIVFFGWSNVL